MTVAPVGYQVLVDGCGHLIPTSGFQELKGLIVALVVIPLVFVARHCSSARSLECLRP